MTSVHQLHPHTALSRPYRLDVQTARWIIDKCFSGDLVKGRTVILVTHHVHMAQPVAEYLVSLRASPPVLPLPLSCHLVSSPA